MLKVRKSEDRGSGDYGWLKTRYTFSFSQYYDPAFQGFRDLVVINEDLVDPGYGFPAHPHQDMEVITYIISGQLTHQDSTGAKATIKAGEIQVMTAGTGISHSEYNTGQEAVHLLQIWIKPNKTGLKPDHLEKSFPQDFDQNQLGLMVSPDGIEDSAIIHQDAKIFVSHLDKDNSLKYQLGDKRFGWVQLITGKIKVNNQILDKGDGLSLVNESGLEIQALAASQLLFFDLS